MSIHLFHPLAVQPIMSCVWYITGSIEIKLLIFCLGFHSQNWGVLFQNNHHLTLSSETKDSDICDKIAPNLASKTMLTTTVNSCSLSVHWRVANGQWLSKLLAQIGWCHFNNCGWMKRKKKNRIDFLKKTEYTVIFILVYRKVFI